MRGLGDREQHGVFGRMRWKRGEKREARADCRPFVPCVPLGAKFLQLEYLVIPFLWNIIFTDPCVDRNHFHSNMTCATWCTLCTEIAWINYHKSTTHLWNISTQTAKWTEGSNYQHDFNILGDAVLLPPHEYGWITVVWNLECPCVTWWLVFPCHFPSFPPESSKPLHARFVTFVWCNCIIFVATLSLFCLGQLR